MATLRRGLKLIPAAHLRQLLDSLIRDSLPTVSEEAEFHRDLQHQRMGMSRSTNSGRASTCSRMKT
jgi:hypothetical protein